MQRDVVDIDAEIASRIGMSIASFFARFGEAPFRALEAEAVAEVARRTDVIIATGGGAVLSPANWAAWRAGSVVIALDAAPDELVARVARHAASEGSAAERPLLAGDALARITELVHARRHLYQQADEIIDTTGLELDEVLVAALAAVERVVVERRLPSLSLATSGERSDIFIGHGVIDALPAVISQRWPNARRAWLIADSSVNEVWGDRVRQGLGQAGLLTELMVIPSGESSKSFAEVERLTGALTAGGVTRRDLIVALGGGVTGDLAGFVASITLRGLPIVQVPTSLLAMVDSSVGGKTGINLPAGKNLVGAFYQPGVVAIEPRFLTTLPAAEYRSGMAEVIKHAYIQPSTPLGGTELNELLERLPIAPIPEDEITRVLRLNVAIKHSVVKADERESGLRMILNFGHTAGHAIEADGYRYRHGEAVGLGMLVASRLAHSLKRVDDTYVSGVERLVERAGLPTRAEGSVESIVRRLAADKKNVDGALNWILPDRDGLMRRVTDVPLDLVKGALAEIGAT